MQSGRNRRRRRSSQPLPSQKEQRWSVFFIIDLELRGLEFFIIGLEFSFGSELGEHITSQTRHLYTVNNCSGPF